MILENMKNSLLLLVLAFAFCGVQAKKIGGNFSHWKFLESANRITLIYWGRYADGKELSRNDGKGEQWKLSPESALYQYGTQNGQLIYGYEIKNYFLILKSHLTKKNYENQFTASALSKDIKIELKWVECVDNRYADFYTVDSYGIYRLFRLNVSNPNELERLIIDRYTFKTSSDNSNLEECDFTIKINTELGYAEGILKKGNESYVVTNLTDYSHYPDYFDAYSFLNPQKGKDNYYLHISFISSRLMGVSIQNKEKNINIDTYSTNPKVIEEFNSWLKQRFNYEP